MPKLNKATASKVAKTELLDFSPLPAGIYSARLTDVTARETRNGDESWSWEFEVTDEEFEGRKLWVNTVMTEKAFWKVHEVFDAFGYSTDSDTDEMIGEEVRLQVVTQIQERGKRAGEEVNDVRKVLPMALSGDEDDDEAPF